MSAYEILAVTALAALLGYAYYLYRKDTRPKAPGEEVVEPKNTLMFGRDPPKDQDGKDPRT